MSVEPGGGGLLGQKVYTTARMATRNPYPQWHKICRTLPLLAQIWARIHTLTGTNTQKIVPSVAQLVFKNGSLAQFLARSTENLANSALFLAQPVQKPYPLWHTFGVQDSTLSGTLLENPTLCGTEIGQNGTLAVLAYVYRHQWEHPPRGVEQAVMLPTLKNSQG